MKKLVILTLLFSLIGCGKTNVEVASSDRPLTVEEWKELEVVEKYQPETLDRLKHSNPSFEEEWNWNRFMRDVVVPERRKDIPTDY